MPTLHWTAYHQFTNPLCLPLTNTHDSIEKNKEMLYRLTSTLTPRQFTYVGYKKLLKTFTAPRANEFTIEYYDHIINRPNQDQFLDEDRFANPQSPTPTTPEISSSTLRETPTLLSQPSTSNIPSDYLGSTPRSEQIRENPFNPPPQSHITTTILGNSLIYTR